MPLTVVADPGRPSIKLPCAVLGLVVLAALVVPVVAAVAGPRGSFQAVVPGCVLAFLLAGAVLSFIRLVYVRGTRLVLDEGGLALDQPFAAWRVAWADIVLVSVTSPYDPTHRGGIAAGVRLRLADGTSRHVPDVLSIERHELARMIIEGGRTAQSG